MDTTTLILFSLTGTDTVPTISGFWYLSVQLAVSVGILVILLFDLLRRIFLHR